MKVAVFGGTGLVGRHTVEALERREQEVVVASRSHGVDLMTSAGLDEALQGVDVVIDVTSIEGADLTTTRNLFGTMTRNLLAAEQRANIKHHVLLSILGLDLIDGNPHYAGKRVQEDLVSRSTAPFTIVRAAQFYEFAEMVVNWVKTDAGAVIPPMLLQPVAVSDVADVLAEIAIGGPEGHIDLAGPEPQDFVDMTRRALAAAGQSVKLIPSWEGLFGVEAAGDIMLPDADARIAPTTFDEWLKQRSAG
ncbi:MAG TPA: SDR family oxidoreductase [Pyrinomonadaceae bacterium]